jgi:hypothetical protein
VDDQPNTGESGAILLHGRHEVRAEYRQQEILLTMAARRQRARNTFLALAQEARQSGATSQEVAIRVIELLCDRLNVDRASLTLSDGPRHRIYQFSRHQESTGTFLGRLAELASETAPSHLYIVEPPSPLMSASFVLCCIGKAPANLSPALPCFHRGPDLCGPPR